MSYLKVAPFALLVMAGSSAMAQSFTVATFSDPTVGQAFASSSLFTFNHTTSQLTGSWIDGTSSGNLTVTVGSTTFTNSSFSMAPVSATAVVAGLYSLGAGSAKFSTATDPDYLTISWNSGFLVTAFGFGSTSPAGSVTFGGSSVASLPASTLSQGSFNFGFGNVQNSGNTQTSTASFTASAVPEPFTIAVLGLGAALALTQRRKTR
ncbi:MAG: PEP-CTERM sorting domain-containing protein [Fimbriimonadaceae bacterium]|nr:PEP-CTERM sorting domain-containing protein [Fimbriimonadaceae bacterium]